MASVLHTHNLNKFFGEKDTDRVCVLSNINLAIERGEFFVLVGPSGCGKSTLLRIISGLDTPTDGLVQRAPDIGRFDMSFVFQQFALLPWMTVYENIALGLVAQHIPTHECRMRVAAELERLNLRHIASAYPRELSGGMRQRVGIARAFVTKPKIIFMDEPFSELDSFTAEELRAELLAIWADTKPTIIMVTHIIEEALELADRVAVMTPRPGKIEEIVVNTLARPRKKRTEAFYTLEDRLYKLIKP